MISFLGPFIPYVVSIFHSFLIVLSWPKSPFSFFHKIKVTFLIFTNNFIDLDILYMLAISHMDWLFSINVSIWQLSSLNDLPDTLEHHPERNFRHETSQTSFDTFDQSQHLLTEQLFFPFQLHFYLSWNNIAQYAKNVTYFLSSSILKWLHKNSPILIN